MRPGAFQEARLKIAIMQEETGRGWSSNQKVLARQLEHYRLQFGDPPWAEEFLQLVHRRWMIRVKPEPVYPNSEEELEDLPQE